MNWFNNMVIDLQKKIWTSPNVGVAENSIWGKPSKLEQERRRCQFQSRLAALDKRLLELR